MDEYVEACFVPTYRFGVTFMIYFFYQHGICQGSAECDQNDAPSSDAGAAAGSSTSAATTKGGEDHGTNKYEAKAIPGAREGF